MKQAVTIFGALAALTSATATAQAGQTSCDITTGASCFWGRGCDCDHDGYVRESGKAYKYCHWAKCPIDKNDSDANVLGKPSQYNTDGDGWTADYDCDDNDACVTNDCSNVCGPGPTDDDGDGYPVGEDCDDTNPYIKPQATLACCSCDILTVPSQVAAYGCAANPCPYGDTNPPVDTSPPADAWTGADTSGSAGTDTMSPGSDVLGADVMGNNGSTNYSAPPAAPGVLASGNVVHPSPPSPVGCAGGGGGVPGALAVALGLLWVVVARRRRAARLAVAAAVVTTLGVSGCATVQPWERGRLAKAPMIFGADGWGDGLEQHFFQYREGAAGGFGGGGGGCGCN